MSYNLSSDPSKNPSSLTPGYGTAHAGEESGIRHEDCTNNMCTDTSGFYVGCTNSNIGNEMADKLANEAADECCS